MTTNKINFPEFLALSASYPILDVRSPGEYEKAHIPGALNLPLFTDVERAAIGTTYKQVSREKAVKLGLDFFGPNMTKIVLTVEAILKKSRSEKINSKRSDGIHENPPQSDVLLIHCARGGMRSAAVAWLLSFYGFQVYVLIGGYKAYRFWVLEQFSIPYDFKVIGGFTGSGKTPLLQALANENYAMIDLEGIANHKGSALGALGNPPQPTQEMFENLLAYGLYEQTQTESNDETVGPRLERSIFIEDESQRIGNLQIPNSLYEGMRKAPVYFLDIPFENRLAYLTIEYSVHPKDKLVSSIMRIQKRLGGLETKNAINFLLEDDFKESFRILLRYYDKWYEKGLHNREDVEKMVRKIPMKTVNTAENTELIKTAIKNES